MLNRYNLINEVDKIDVDLSSDSLATLLNIASDIAYDEGFENASESDFNQYVEDIVIDLVDDGVINESEAFIIIRTINIALRECRE